MKHLSFLKLSNLTVLYLCTFLDDEAKNYIGNKGCKYLSRGVCISL